MSFGPQRLAMEISRVETPDKIPGCAWLNTEEVSQVNAAAGAGAATPVTCSAFDSKRNSRDSAETGEMALDISRVGADLTR